MGSIPWSEEEGEYHRDLDTMDRWSVAEIGKHWLSVTDLYGFYEVGLDRGASNRPSCPKDRVDNLWRMGIRSILLGASVSNLSFRISRPISFGFADDCRALAIPS